MSREMPLPGNDAELSNQLAAAKEMNYSLRKASGELERQNSQLRVDMQSLNDLYYVGHKQFLEAQIEVKSLSMVKEEKKELLTQMSKLNAHLDIAQKAENLMKNEKMIILQNHQIELNKILNSNEENQRILENTVRDLQNKANVLSDREKMGSEDRVATEHRLESLTVQSAYQESSLKREVTALQNYTDLLQRSSVDKETDLIAMTATTADMSKKHKILESEMLLKISEMVEITSLLKVQNQELEKDVSSLFEELKSSKSVAAIRASEKDELILVISQVRNQKLHLEENIVVLQSEVESLKAKAVADNLESATLLQQLSEDQAKHSAFVTRSQDIETAFNSETRKQSVKCVALEAKLLKQEKAEQQERATATHMAAMLREELEKRVDELTSAISQRSALEEERPSLLKRIEELEAGMKSKEIQIKKGAEVQVELEPRLLF